jgi:hypothetical protein
MDRKLKMSVGIGGPSIIMIFVILCLTTLSALSLMTANAEWKLTKKASQSVADYYSADSKAEEILASSDASLKAGLPLKADTFTVRVSENQDLIMKLGVNGMDYSVLSRKLVPRSQWDYDQYKIEFDDRIKE